MNETRTLKGNERVISSDPSCKDDPAQFTTVTLTLSLLGYLKTRICWGGQIDLPSKSHVLCPNMTNDTSLESSCALLLESAKKFENLQKLNFLLKPGFRPKGRALGT